MPREMLFTRQQMIEAAFGILAREGMEAISARRLAAVLGCSTAPVYSGFRNMEELKSLLLRHALERLLEYTRQTYTPHVFLNMGVGMLEFANEYPQVYRTLFLDSGAHRHIFSEFSRRGLKQMKGDPVLAVFDDHELAEILDKLTVYTHGMAAFICADMFDERLTQDLVHKLGAVGGDIMVATALKTGKLERFMRGEVCVEEDNANQRRQ